jgi:hypothetical protein
MYTSHPKPSNELFIDQISSILSFCRLRKNGKMENLTLYTHRSLLER